MKIYVHIYGSTLKLGQSWSKGLAPTCVCVCGSISVVSAVGTRSLELKPVKQEMMMMMMMMCKGIQYQTMIHFKSLLDMIQRTRDICAAMWKTDRQSELPNNDNRIKKKKKAKLDKVEGEVLRVVWYELEVFRDKYGQLLAKRQRYKTNKTKKN